MIWYNEMDWNEIERNDSIEKTKICNLKGNKYKMKLSVFPFFGFHFVKKIIHFKTPNHLKKHFIIHDFEISTSSDSSL